jgi:hypothetical protein
MFVPLGPAASPNPTSRTQRPAGLFGCSPTLSGYIFHPADPFSDKKKASALNSSNFFFVVMTSMFIDLSIYSFVRSLNRLTYAKMMRVIRIFSELFTWQRSRFYVFESHRWDVWQMCRLKCLQFVQTGHVTIPGQLYQSEGFYHLQIRSRDL